MRVVDGKQEIYLEWPYLAANLLFQPACFHFCLVHIPLFMVVFDSTSHSHSRQEPRSGSVELLYTILVVQIH